MKKWYMPKNAMVAIKLKMDNLFISNNKESFMEYMEVKVKDIGKLRYDDFGFLVTNWDNITVK